MVYRPHRGPSWVAGHPRPQRGDPREAEGTLHRRKYRASLDWAPRCGEGAADSVARTGWGPSGTEGRKARSLSRAWGQAPPSMSTLPGATGGSRATWSPVTSVTGVGAGSGAQVVPRITPRPGGAPVGELLPTPASAVASWWPYTLPLDLGLGHVVFRVMRSRVWVAVGA